jgi:hypothetical protein
MKVWIAAAALIAGVTGAGAQTSTVDPALAKIYFDCLKREAVLMDDGISDAGTIAVGVANNCAPARNALAVASGRGDLQLQRMMQDTLDAKAQASATSFVLTMRKAKQQRPPAPAAKPKAKGETI